MENKRTKILVVTERFFPEDFVINDLVSEWHKNGLSVSVLTQAPSYPYGKVFSGYKNRIYFKENWNGVDIYRFKTVEGYKGSLILKLLNYINFAILGSIVAVFIGRKFDKIFVYQTGPLTLTLPAVLIKKLFSKDISIWTQDIWPDSVYAYGFKKSFFLTRTLNWFVGFIYRNCKQFFIPCEGQRKKIAAYVKDKEIHYVPNWSMIEKDDNTRTVILSDKFNFTFAGNIGKVQNLDNVIKGFSMAQKESPAMQLNIIGDGSNLNELKEMVIREQISWVVFWGRKSPQEIMPYLKASDVLIISLKDDPIFEVTIPAKFQAYLMAERPVFCVVNGALKDIVDNNKIGLSATASNIVDIKTKFQEFSNFNKMRMIDMTDNMKKLRENSFNKDKIIRRLTELFLD